MTNTVGDALKTFRVSTGLQHLAFAQALLAQGFHAACTSGEQAIADELKQLEDYDATCFTDDELAHLSGCCRHLPRHPSQRQLHAILTYCISRRLLGHLPTIMSPPPTDPPEQP